VQVELGVFRSIRLKCLGITLTISGTNSVPMFLELSGSLAWELTNYSVLYLVYSNSPQSHDIRLFDSSKV